MVSHVPQVTEIAPAVNGEGLKLSGWFATWDQDSADEAFVRDAFDQSLPRYLSTNPIVLHMHNKSEPPVGRVISAHVDKSKGVYGTVLLPRPELGTKAMDIYNSVKNGLLKSFSVGGFWKRFQAAGSTKLICERLLEISLAGPNVNEYAVAEGDVEAVQGVKAIGGRWYTAAEIQTAKALNDLALIDLRLTYVEQLRSAL